MRLPRSEHECEQHHIDSERLRCVFPESVLHYRYVTVSYRIGESMSADAQIIHDRRWWTLLVLSTALLVISLDNTILNVALPTIERDLDAGSGQLQWIVDSYTLVFAGLLLTMGALGDRFSRRGALVAGLVIFGGASLASAFAESANMLIATRSLMGIGGALIMPTTLSILTNVFQAGERAKAIGI